MEIKDQILEILTVALFFWPITLPLAAFIIYSTIKYFSDRSQKKYELWVKQKKEKEERLAEEEKERKNQEKEEELRKLKEEWAEEKRQCDEKEKAEKNERLKAVNDKYIKNIISSLSQLPEAEKPSDKKIFRTNEEHYSYLMSLYGPDHDFESDMDDLYTVLECAVAATLTLTEFLAYDPDRKELPDFWAIRDKYSLPLSRTGMKKIETGWKKLRKICMRLNTDYGHLGLAEKDYKITRAGVEGENTVKEKIISSVNQDWEFFDGAVLPIINPRTELEKKLKEFETDFIVVTDRSVVCFEVNNYKTGSLMINKAGQVKHLDNNGRIIKNDGPDERNMIEQCEDHVMYLIRLFEENNLPSVPVRGIIVIANDNINIESNETDYPVILKGSIGSEIRKGNERIDKKAVVDIIKNNLREPHRYPRDDYAPSFTDKDIDAIKYASAMINQMLSEKLDIIIAYEPSGRAAAGLRWEALPGTDDGYEILEAMSLRVGKIMCYKLYENLITYPNRLEQKRETLEIYPGDPNWIDYFMDITPEDANEPATYDMTPVPVAPAVQNEWYEEEYVDEDEEEDEEVWSPPEQNNSPKDEETEDEDKERCMDDNFFYEEEQRRLAEEEQRRYIETQEEEELEEESNLTFWAVYDPNSFDDDTY